MNLCHISILAYLNQNICKFWQLKLSGFIKGIQRICSWKADSLLGSHWIKSDTTTTHYRLRGSQVHKCLDSGAKRWWRFTSLFLHLFWILVEKCNPNWIGVGKTLCLCIYTHKHKLAVHNKVDCISSCRKVTHPYPTTGEKQFGCTQTCTHTDMHTESL